MMKAFFFKKIFYKNYNFLKKKISYFLIIKKKIYLV